MAKKNTQQYREVDPTILAPSPHQNRNMQDADLESLIESIKQFGVLEPVLAREEGGTLFLIAGERRTRAAVAAKLKTIPVRVLEISADEAAALTVEENMQREDLTPMEEARGIETLLGVHGGDAEAVAERIGRSPGWVARRARLVDLSPKWLARVENREDQVSTWGVEALTIIARLPVDVQEEISGSLFGHWQAELRMTAAAVQEKVNAALRLISKAAWKPDDEFKDLPTCTGCPKRSDSQSHMFDDLGSKPQCLDASCWGQKAGLVVLGQLKEKVQPAMDGSIYNRGNELVVQESQIAGNVYRLPRTDQMKRQAKSKGGTPVVIVNGPLAGNVVHVKPEALERELNRYNYDYGTESKKPDGPKPLAERRAALKLRRLKSMADKGKEYLEGLDAAPEHLDDAMLLRMVAAFGVGEDDYTMRYRLDAVVKGFNAKAFEKTFRDRLWARLAMKLKNLLHWEYVKVAARNHQSIVQTAYTLLGLDWKTTWKDVLKEIPEPKSWKLLNPDGTPKAKGKS